MHLDPRRYKDRFKPAVDLAIPADRRAFLEWESASDQKMICVREIQQPSMAFHDSGTNQALLGQPSCPHWQSQWHPARGNLRWRPRPWPLILAA